MTRPNRPADAATSAGEPVCVVCGGAHWRLLHRRLRDRRGADAAPCDILACRGCGAGRTWPPPTATELARLYDSAYAPGPAPDLAAIAEATAALRAGHAGPGDWWRRLNATDVPALLHLQPTAAHLPRGGRALDVGAHAGETLAWLAAAGFEAEGLEPNPAAARTAVGLGFAVRRETLEDAALPTDRYDLVTLSCVIEHLPDPAAALGKLRGALRPGGKLLLTTHNLTSVWRHLFRRRWVNWHPPFHLHHFDSGTLRRLASDTGLTLCHVETRTPVYWLVYSWRGSEAIPAPDRLVGVGRLARMADRALPGDCLIAILERPA